MRPRLSSRLRALLPALALQSILLQSTLLLGGAALSAPAHAVRAMDLRAEQLMVGADSIRKDLELTPNQQTLWQNTVGKAQALLRTRQTRRDRLQSDMKAALSAGVPDLRDLNGRIDAESDASVAEDRALRELWLTVNDALTDKQRSQVIALLVSQLERIDADGARAPGGAGSRDGGKGPGGGGPGGRGQRPGGMGGGSAGGSIGIGGFGG